MIFSTFFVALVYPIAGSWKWGGGFLDAMGFYDFAGSTLVHSVGGWGALVGALVLGPRLGKYSEDGKLSADPGQQHAAGHDRRLPALARMVRVQRRLGAVGRSGAHLLRARDDLPRGGRGRHRRDGRLHLRQLEARPLDGAQRHPRRPGRHHRGRGRHQTRRRDPDRPHRRLLVVGSVIFFDSIKIDDPVGAISVHLVCGIWGTLAVGIFSTNPEHSLGSRLIGVALLRRLHGRLRLRPLRRAEGRRSGSGSPRRKSSRASTSASTACMPTTSRIPGLHRRAASGPLRQRHGFPQAGHERELNT